MSDKKEIKRRLSLLEIIVAFHTAANSINEFNTQLLKKYPGKLKYGS